MSIQLPIVCPICRSPLSLQQQSLCCPQNHSFDTARQGYWNLLLSHKKRSRTPGDNAAMIQARRRFLELGLYQPLSDRINELALNLANNPVQPFNALDIGCGEGYYSMRLYHAFKQASYSLNLAGIDISKAAIKAACQRSSDINWLVASAVDIPLAPESIDLQLALFTRLLPQSFAKTMKPNGQLLVAYSGELHLIELRQLIYNEIKRNHSFVLEDLEPYFKLEQLENINDKFRLDNNQAIQDLLQMTPHGQHLSSEARNKLQQQNQLNLTLDIKLAQLVRR